MSYPGRNATELRRVELAQIHIAKKQLGMDDDAYRNLLFSIARVWSAEFLDWTGRKRLIEHFKKCGWKPAPPKRAKAGKPIAPGQDGLVRQLWSELHEMGRIRDNSDTALAAWLKRNRWPERPEWLDGKQITQAIEALKKWRDR